MVKHHMAAFLVVAVLLFAIKPGTGRGQTFLQPNAANEPHYLGDTQTNLKPGLRASFAAEMARIKSGALTKADFNRIEKQSQNPKPESTFPKRDKIFLAVWIIVMTALVIVLIKHPCKVKNPGDCEFVDDTTQ